VSGVGPDARRPLTPALDPEQVAGATLVGLAGMTSAPLRDLVTRHHGTIGALRSTTSSILRPVVGTKIRSVFPISLIATFGLI